MRLNRVLIVDDNQDLAEGFKDLLESEAYQVTLAHSGEVAISLCQSNSYHINFLDVKLPGVDGVKTLMDIQNIHPTIRVVMMSGYRIGELLEEVKERGAFSFLQKPFTKDQMLAMIDSIKPVSGQ